MFDNEAVMSHFGFGHNLVFDTAVSSFEKGDTIGAIEQFRICLASEPDPSTRERARSYLAGCYVRLAKLDIASNEWETALDNLDEAAFQRPAFADVRILRSIVFDHLGKQEDRRFEITFALDFNPRFALAVLHDGIFELEFGDHALGIARIKESASIDKRLNSDLYHTALDTYDMGDVEKSIQLFKQVVPVNVNDPVDLINEGNKAAHTGQWAEAENAYRKALEFAPRYADVRCKHGRVLIELGLLSEAIAQLREAVDINPRYADAYAFLGVALKAAGHTNQALDAFSAALAIDPDHVVALRETKNS